MKRLVTLGCSHTFGEGVKDPSKESWPALLSQRFNMELFNLGEPGGSNRTIQHNVYKHKFRKDDTVIILWTYPDRYHFFRDKDNHTGLINSWGTGRSTVWFKDFHTEYNEKFDNETIVNQVNLYLDKLNIEHYNLVVDLDFNYYFKTFDINYIKEDFNTNYLKKFARGVDGWHMGFDGNRAYANFIYNYINSSSTII